MACPTSLACCLLAILYQYVMTAEYYDTYSDEMEKLGLDSSAVTAVPVMQMSRPSVVESVNSGVKSDMSEGVKSLAMVGRSVTTVTPRIPLPLMFILLGVIAILLLLACVVSLVRARRRKKLIEGVAMTPVDVELSSALYGENTKSEERKTFLSNISFPSWSTKWTTQETQPESTEKPAVTLSSPVPRRISVTSPRGSTKDLWETPPMLERPRSYTWSDCEDTIRSGHREIRRSVSVQLISDDDDVPMFEKLSHGRKKKKRRKR